MKSVVRAHFVWYGMSWGFYGFNIFAAPAGSQHRPPDENTYLKCRLHYNSFIMNITTCEVDLEVIEL